MTSPNNVLPFDPLLQQLRERALRSCRPSSHERWLMQQVMTYANKTSEMLRKGVADAPLTASAPPQELIRAWRRPKGRQIYVSVEIGGQVVPLVVNTRGDADPEREAYLWGWLRDRVERKAA